MKLREKVARAIAHAKTGLDPDTRTLPFTPMSLGDGAVALPPEDNVVALYTRYLGAADAALAAIREHFKAEGIIDPDREV